MILCLSTFDLLTILSDKIVRNVYLPYVLIRLLLRMKHQQMFVLLKLLSQVLLYCINSSVKSIVFIRRVVILTAEIRLLTKDHLGELLFIFYIFDKNKTPWPLYLMN